MNILVVDNSPVLCAGITALLSGVEGITLMSEAHDARSAWQAIEELRPHLVTLDVQLNGGRGIELLRKLKRLDPAPFVIVLTNSGSQQYRDKCQEAGADFFLDKATEWTKLKALVQGLLNTAAAPASLHHSSGGNQ